MPEAEDDEAAPLEDADEFCEIEGTSRIPLEEATIFLQLATLAASLHLPLPVLETEEREDKDWLQAVYQDFPPLTIGRYFIYGSHYEGEKPANLLPLEVNAATAFGSGEHPSTWGCLLALDDLFKERHFKKPLDMGCGSGILALAIAKTLASLQKEGVVMAADNDPESVRVTAENASLNRCEERLQVFLSVGFTNSALQEKGPYDLIVANILATPLCEMAPSLAKALAPTGVVVLSGLLLTQKERVLSAYEAEGLRFWFEKALEPWTTLVLTPLS